MIAQPVGQFFFGEFTGRESLKSDYDLSISCSQAVTVQLKESFTKHGSGALVAIHERMVTSHPPSQGSGQTRNIIFTVCRQILAPCHAAFE